jgi:hypothetical protein
LVEGTYDELAAAFQALVDNYIAKKCPRKTAESITRWKFSNEAV